MTVLDKIVVGAVAAAAMLQMPGTAVAEKYRFAISVDLDYSNTVGILCEGPVLRTSACRDVPDGQRTVFYTADDYWTSPRGDWNCTLYSSCADRGIYHWVNFCGPGAGGSNSDVELTAAWAPGEDGPRAGGIRLTVNQASSCAGTRIVTRSVLGQTGEADDTPAQDTDTYRFPGKAGEKVEVKLERDGSTGSLGAVATLRLRAPDGASLGEETGPVPLRLKATLPGDVEVVVVRDGKSGNALRGGYELEIAPASGDSGGRVLLPSSNVEG
jgi:hypothetical protein